MHGTDINKMRLLVKQGPSSSCSFWLCPNI